MLSVLYFSSVFFWRKGFRTSVRERIASVQRAPENSSKFWFLIKWIMYYSVAPYPTHPISLNPGWSSHERRMWSTNEPKLKLKWSCHAGLMKGGWNLFEVWMNWNWSSNESAMKDVWSLDKVWMNPVRMNWNWSLNELAMKPPWTKDESCEKCEWTQMNLPWRARLVLSIELKMELPRSLGETGSSMGTYQIYSSIPFNEIKIALSFYDQIS